MLGKCIECDGDLSDSAKKCPHCGGLDNFYNPNQKTGKPKLVTEEEKLGNSVFFIVMIVGSFLFLVFGPKGRALMFWPLNQSQFILDHILKPWSHFLSLVSSPEDILIKLPLTVISIFVGWLFPFIFIFCVALIASMVTKQLFTKNK